MNLTLDIIRNLVNEEVSRLVLEDTTQELEDNAIDTISGILIRLDAEGIGTEEIVNKAKTDIREIEVHNISKDALIVDVREESEFAQSHAKGSIHIGKGILERDIEKHVPDTDRLLVLYCGGGYRSALAAQRLQQMGYTNVFSLQGGFRAWNAADKEVESE